MSYLFKKNLKLGIEVFKKIKSNKFVRIYIKKNV